MLGRVMAFLETCLRAIVSGSVSRVLDDVFFDWEMVASAVLIAGWPFVLLSSFFGDVMGLALIVGLVTACVYWRRSQRDRCATPPSGTGFALLPGEALPPVVSTWDRFNSFIGDHRILQTYLIDVDFQARKPHPRWIHNDWDWYVRILRAPVPTPENPTPLDFAGGLLLARQRIKIWRARAVNQSVNARLAASVEYISSFCRVLTLVPKDLVQSHGSFNWHVMTVLMHAYAGVLFKIKEVVFQGVNPQTGSPELRDILRGCPDNVKQERTNSPICVMNEIVRSYDPTKTKQDFNAWISMLRNSFAHQSDVRFNPAHNYHLTIVDVKGKVVANGAHSTVVLNQLRRLIIVMMVLFD